MTYIIVTIKSWNIANYEKLAAKRGDCEFHLITKKEHLTLERLEKFKPRYIFFPHWSWIIPNQVFEKYECIVFHMTDLPYGQGGSPLQNLIVRGHSKTKMSALRVEEGLDTGPIYFKEHLSLEGSAEAIFREASALTFRMIQRIIDEEPTPQPQVGQPVIFTRRKPKGSDLSKLGSEKELYDYIRMLDAAGYPPAFLETPKYKIEFSVAEQITGGVKATAYFTIKK